MHAAASTSVGQCTPIRRREYPTRMTHEIAIASVIPCAAGRTRPTHTTAAVANAAVASVWPLGKLDPQYHAVSHRSGRSQRPLWETNHVVSNVSLQKISGNGDVEVRSRFHMMELRRDDVRHFAGSYFHKLKKTKKGYAIRLQRVDMANAQAAYDYVLQVWV